ncbi:hypothetical protein VV089_23560 [Candidatus Merdisoma sp. JLR.KK011]|uniref:hypothetical protein n=1 Tax=Candidatus Merdisoma sp. JLR.KK011 TaxID=3114299 RepID=UPI002FF1FAB2
MLYYLGKGTEFKKEECKEYKTIEGALRAAAKDEAFVVWDENGKVVGGLTDNVPEGALKTNPDGSVPAFDKSGHPVGTVDAETAQKATGEGAETATDGQNGAEPEKSTPETENAGNGANTEPEESETIIPQGTMRVTVICDGTLNLRRSAEWGNENICGRASRGQSYYVKAIHTVQGKKMVQTIDDVYLSGQSEHVQFEQL